MSQQFPESEVLLLCACQRMAEDRAGRVAGLCGGEGFCWDGLFQAAVSHQIAPLVLTNLERAGAVARMPSAVAGRWKNLRTRNILAKKKQVRIVRQVVEFLARRSVRVMLLKGAALDAVVYDESWYTQSADADLMAERPYGELSQADQAAVDALVKGARVELDWARHHDLDMNRVLNIDYGRLWAGASPVAVGDAPAYVLSPENMLLTACINFCRKRYRLLKWMIGIRELIVAYPRLDWEELARNALACGANGIVYAALTVTGVVLGCEPPDQAMRAMRVGGVRGWAIRQLSLNLSRWLFRIPESTREPAARLLTSHLLRVTSYRVSHLRREVHALIAVRRFRATHEGAVRRASLKSR